MAGQLRDRDGGLLEMTRRRGLGRGDKKKHQKSRESVVLGRAVVHPWSGAGTFGEVR